MTREPTLRDVLLGRVTPPVAPKRRGRRPRAAVPASDPAIAAVRTDQVDTTGAPATPATARRPHRRARAASEAISASVVAENRSASATVPHAASATIPTFAPLPLWVNQETQALSEEARSDLARAQAAWLMGQQTLDPRHALYSERVTPEDLERTLRILRGLFDRRAMRDVPLVGALHWIEILMNLGFEAEDRGRSPILPMPYLFVFQRELNEMGERLPHDTTDWAALRRR